MILAGDVGGTKTILALIEHDRITRRETFPSARYASLEEMAKGFLGPAAGHVTRACFGVAGPVFEDVCRATNLPWLIDARAIERLVNIPRVRLVNDFTALSIGIANLEPAALSSLNDAPSNPHGPWVVIGAGTGLGQAVVVKTHEGYDVLASEGGHTDFAPRDELEVELLRWLLKRHERVSYERIVSGPGLATLYEFMREHRVAPESKAVRAEMEASEDQIPAIVSMHALAGDDALCMATLDRFVSIYGAEAGNLALKVLARGGVYVAGGIAPKILAKMKDGTFMRAFLTKGRMRPILEQTPVKVVLNEDAGLIGAASIAARLTL